MQLQSSGHYDSWIAGDIRPLGIANDPGFQNLLKYLEPGYFAPSQTTVSKMIHKRHERAKEDLVKKLKDAKAVSVTTNTWTSKAVQSFVTYTIHFINPVLWKLESFVPATSHFEGSHTGVNLAEATKKVIENLPFRKGLCKASSRMRRGMQSQLVSN